MAPEDLDELAALAETAGAEPIARVVQTRADADPATYVGKGKIQEVHDEVHATGADSVILDSELSPGQLRNLEERLGVKVIDRTALILDIFALHAHTREGKTQVELAQLNYLLPRLRGWGEAMSRLGGGIGTRGPGETKLEVDRQHIRKRITKLRREIEDLGRTREVKRSSRERSGIPQIAIAGYTNAGKSTLLTLAGALDRPTAGRVFLRGRDLSQLSPDTLAALRRRMIGFVFQDLNLLPGLNALENAALPLELDGVPLGEARAQALEALRGVRMDALSNRFPDDLSGGEQQRVAIARAIAKNPAVLLCDEPTGALDSATGIVVLEALARANRDLGTTTVVITHNVVIAEMADRVIRMADGRISGSERNAERKEARELAW